VLRKYFPTFYINKALQVLKFTPNLVDAQSQVACFDRSILSDAKDQVEFSRFAMGGYFRTLTSTGAKSWLTVGEMVLSIVCRWMPIPVKWVEKICDPSEGMCEQSPTQGNTH
jgi:hypothetical protein